MNERTQRSAAKRVLEELDNVFLRVFDELRSDHIQPTQEQKEYALSIIKQSPAYTAIMKAVQRGTEADLKEAQRIVREKFFAAIRKPLLEAVRKLPHPSGGRPKLLSEDQKREARREIGALMGNDCKLKDAIKRVADRFEVSPRTMYRVWQGRLKQNK